MQVNTWSILLCPVYLTFVHVIYQALNEIILPNNNSSVSWPIWSWGDMADDSTEIQPLWAVLARAGMSTPWCCPPSISSANHAIIHHQRCPEGWFSRGCHSVWHAWTMRVSISWQLPEEVPVDPQGSWSCSAPSHWSCAQSRRCREVSLAIFGFMEALYRQHKCLTKDHPSL